MDDFEKWCIEMESNPFPVKITPERAWQAAPASKSVLSEDIIDGIMRNIVLPANRGDVTYSLLLQQIRHALAPYMAKPRLCEDEGCAHYGTPHVCITPTTTGG